MARKKNVPVDTGLSNTKWRDQAVRHGLKFARFVFDKRGNNTEAHVTESELAAMMSVSFEAGAQADEKRARIRFVEVRKL